MSENSGNTYIKGYKFQAYPTEEQKQMINKYIDLYRFVYNWGIAQEEEQYKLKKDRITTTGFLRYFDLNLKLTEFRNKPGNEWIKEIPNSTSRLALRDVANAYIQFFKHPDKFHSPKFKSKKRSKKYFKTRNDRFSINGNRFRFEGMAFSKGKGKNIPLDEIQLHFDTGFFRDDKVKYICPTISVDNLDRYWVSFSVEEECIDLDTPKTDAIGIDVGVRQTMVLSTGEVFNRPKEKINNLESKLRHAMRHYSRDIDRRMKESIRTKTKYEDIPISNRSQKRLNKVRKLYKRITNIKENFYHETIKSIVLRNPEAIVIENISTRELQKKSGKLWANKYLPKADFRKMHVIIEEKCKKYNVPLIKADKQFKSSQICSVCGNIKDPYSRHVYICPVCGNRMDRDVNAAINLKNLAYIN